MTSYDTTVAELSPFSFPHLLKWRESLYREQYMCNKLYTEANQDLQQLNKEIGAAKRAHRYNEVSEKIQRRMFIQRDLLSLSEPSHARRGILKNLDGALDAGISVYARQSCSALCQPLLNALPRELRDMIYVYLIDDNITQLLASRARCQLSTQSVASHTCDKQLPHILDTSFLPEPMVAEIVDMAADQYVKAKKNQYTAYDFQSLSTYTESLVLESKETDRVTTNVPISRFYVKCRVKVQLGHEMRKWKDTCEVTKTDFIQYVSNRFLSISHGAGCRKLSLDICTVGMEEHDISLFKKEFAPLLEALKKLGYVEVQVNWSERKNARFAYGYNTSEYGSSKFLRAPFSRDWVPKKFDYKIIDAGASSKYGTGDEWMRAWVTGVRNEQRIECECISCVPYRAVSTIRPKAETGHTMVTT